MRCISEQLWVITCNKNCCAAFIQMKWVLFPLAMNRSSGYNPICCPAISAKLRCFEIPCQGGEGSASRICADPGCHDPMIWPAELSEWTCVFRTVWFVESAYRACVSHAGNPDVNSSVVNQREYRTFDVIKSIAIDCVRAQQGVHKVSMFSVLWWIHGTVKPSSSDGPTQGADWVTTVSVTQVVILTQIRFYQPVNELNLTMKVAVNRPPKQ